MNYRTLLGVLILIAGAALISKEVVTGNASVGLAFIVPIITGSGLQFLFGMLCIFVGIITVVMGMAGEHHVIDGREFESPDAKNKGNGRSKVRTGGVLLIGPLPISFGSDAGAMHMAQILAVIMLLLALVFLLFF